MKNLLLLSLFVSSAAYSAAPVRVDSLTFNGSGCPVNNAPVTHHWEGTRLVVNFSDMVPSKGEGLSLVESRKNCTITLDAKAAAGHRYTVRTIRANGFADLGKGDSLVLTTTSFQEGSSETSTLSHTWEGPGDKSFSKHFSIAEEDRVYSSCDSDRALVYNTAVRVANDSGDRDQEAYAALDSLALTVELSRCPGH